MRSLEVLGGGLILAPNSKARDTHGLFARLFSRSAVTALLPRMHARAQALVRTLRRQCVGSPAAIDVEPLFMQLTFALVLRKACGAVAGGDAERLLAAFRAVLADAQRRVMNPFPRAPAALWRVLLNIVPSLRAGAAARAVLQQFVQQQIARRVAGDGADDDGSVLAALMREGGTYFGDAASVTEELITLIFAGHDTTSVSSRFVVLFLSRH